MADVDRIPALPPGVDVEAHTALTTPTIVTKDAGGLS
jgi:hypothetical protein